MPGLQRRVRKVFSPVGIVFKGSGFYRTDSRARDGAKDGAKEARRKAPRKARRTRPLAPLQVRGLGGKADKGDKKPAAASSSSKKSSSGASSSASSSASTSEKVA